MASLTVYTLSNCDRCRAATKWLKARGLSFEERPIRETPPSLAELRRMFEAQGRELRRLFNVSGRDYREQHLGERLDAMSIEEALRLLAANGNLVKRPFLLGDGIAAVGFDDVDWAGLFQK